jgi:hypothetical protein
MNLTWWVGLFEICPVRSLRFEKGDLIQPYQQSSLPGSPSWREAWQAFEKTQNAQIIQSRMDIIQS